MFFQGTMSTYEDLSIPDLRESISAIIRRHIPAAAIDTLSDDADLCALGLDSLRFIWVLADFDRDLGLEIPDQLFHLENFRTLGITLQTVMDVRQRRNEK